MAKRVIKVSLGAFALWAGSQAWAGSGVPVPAKPTTLSMAGAASAPAKAVDPKAPALAQSSGDKSAASSTLQGTLAPQAEPAQTAPKPILAEAFIAQTVLRVYLNRPASIFVYNSRGQQVFHLDSQRPMEAVPLQGLSTGFVYLTVRTAQGEMTKKLVYTGK